MVCEEYSNEGFIVSAITIAASSNGTISIVLNALISNYKIN
jgi:hypothetical protein